MKKIFVPVFTLLLLLGANSMKAQLDSKIATGVIAFNQSEFDKAIKAFDEGLEDISKLKEKNIPKGFYYRGKSRLMKMRQLAQKAAGGADLSEADQNFLQTAVMDSYQDFKSAEQHDDGKWGKKVEAEVQNIGGLILQSGLTILNGTFDAQMSESDKMEAYKETVKYMDVAQEIMPDNYMVYDLRGQASLNLSDSSKALNDFGTAIGKYKEFEPQRPDQLVAYTFYRKALVERYAENDLDAALASLDNGKKLLDKEHQRLAKDKEQYGEQWPALEQQYTNAREDLSRFELDILLNSPGKLQQALDKFDQATKDEPNNYIIHVAYAQLLEKVDKDKAAEIYVAATKINPKKHIAFFNLGAMFVNEGVEKYKQANEEEKNMEKARQLQEEGDALYQKAFPYLQQAHEIEPCEKETLQALLNICINLSSVDESYNDHYTKYKAAQKNCP